MGKHQDRNNCQHHNPMPILPARGAPGVRSKREFQASKPVFHSTLCVCEGGMYVGLLQIVEREVLDNSNYHQQNYYFYAIIINHNYRFQFHGIIMITNFRIIKHEVWGEGGGGEREFMLPLNTNLIKFDMQMYKNLLCIFLCLPNYLRQFACFR